MSWELCVIGTALADPQTMIEAEGLVPSDFTPPNNIIWAEMLNLHHRDALDARALTETLSRSPEGDRIASDTGSLEEYIRQAQTFRGAAMKEYVDQVLNAAIKRAVRRSTALIAAEAQDNRRSAADLLDYAEKQILALRRNRMAAGVDLADIIGVFIPRVQAFREGTFVPAWVPHLQAVKDIIEFLDHTDFWVNAARPGEGKSSLLRFEFFHGSLSHGMRPAIFNLENDPIEYARYMIALDTGIDSKLLKNPNLLSPEQLDRIRSSAEHLARLPLKIITLGGPSASDIVTISRRLIAEWNCNLIGVDYIQLVRNGIEKRVDDVAITTGHLRALALNNNVPVMANSQLSRDIEKRGVEQSDPQLSDLRDSGSIEQDATIVSFIRSLWADPADQEIRQFPENIAPGGRTLERPKVIPVRIFVKKNRNGEIGPSDPVAWNKATGSFRTLVRPAR